MTTSVEITEATSGTPDLALGSAAQPSLQELPLDLVDESPLNRRRHFDKTKFAELCDSVAKDGVLSPVLVRPTAHGRYELAAGHRRRRAALQVKRATIPAVVRPMTDEQFLVTLVTENLQREDLHPLDEAQGYQDLLQLPGYDVEAVAARVGKSISYVYQRLKLVELTAPAQKAFLEDKITAGHAILIARLQPADQARALKAATEERWHGQEGPISVRELARWIQSEVLCELDGAAFKKADPDLVPAAGPCTTCPKRTGHQRELLLPGLDEGNGKKGSHDRCLDPACFQAKVDAHLAQRRAALEAEHGAVLQISENYRTKQLPKEVLPSDKWFEVSPKTQGAKPALIVDGPRAGQTKYVTLQRPVQESGGESWRRQASVEERKRQAKAKREAERRRRIFAAVRAKLPGTLKAPELRALIAGFLTEMVSDSKAKLMAALGLERVKIKGTYGGHYDDQGQLVKHIADFSEPDLVRFLLVLPLASSLGWNPYTTNRSDRDPLFQAAKTYGVNVAAIDRELAAAAKPGKAKKPVHASAKPKKRLAGDVRRAAKKARAKS
jgi:ParB family chromosome partitioning protein